MVSYYDKLLLVIPIAFGLGVLTSLHGGVALYQGLAAGSLASTVVLYEALVRNPPTEPTRAGTVAAAATGLGWFLALALYL